MAANDNAEERETEVSKNKVSLQNYRQTNFWRYNIMHAAYLHRQAKTDFR